MEYTEADYRAFLNQAFPSQVLRGILLGVIDGYKAAPTACKKAMDTPDRHDALGGIRRGKIHEQLRGVAEFHKLLFKDEPNIIGSAFFLSIFSGRYRLVANLVCRKRQIVRPALIRKMWARHNRDSQCALDFIPKEDPVPSDATFLAIIIHGPRGRRRDQPAFVDIVVPDTRFSKYMSRLELFAMFPDIANSLLQNKDVFRKEPRKKRSRGVAQGSTA